MIKTPNISTVYIDPPSVAYLGGRLFDLSDPILNRDDSLLPYYQIKEKFQEFGVEVLTADFLPTKPSQDSSNYYSFGRLDLLKNLQNRLDIKFKAFLIFEPPVVDPLPYKALPFLSNIFEEIYLHNTIGDGYSLKGVDASKLRKLFWPQPREDVILDFWNKIDREFRIVVINGSHVPQLAKDELYSKRIEAMLALAPTGIIDLYGRGWDRWWSRSNMWLPYWKNRSCLMSIYKGPTQNKYETLSKYHFSLCFENMKMSGYVTEKIFDCFYAGTIPIYMGAQDIEKFIPKESFIDFRNFSSWGSMLKFIETLTLDEISRMRLSGRNFILSDSCGQYRKSLLNIFFPQGDRIGNSKVY